MTRYNYLEKKLYLIDKAIIKCQCEKMRAIWERKWLEISDKISRLTVKEAEETV